MTIPEILQKQRGFFLSNATKALDFRKEQLLKLLSILKANEEVLFDAINKDFGKSKFETYATELGMTYHEIKLSLRKMKRWSRRKTVSTNLANFPGKSYIIPEPYGNTLVIGSWNYPIQLTLLPAVSALAAGNTVILKPSELTANCSAAMAKIINSNFAIEVMHVVEGGVKETTELLDQDFDKIFFTGSTAVGKIVMQAAAKHLTPVTLELGGKSPAFVLPDADMKNGVKRLVWGKFLNAGQTCVAPDYILVHESVKDKLIAEMSKLLDTMFGGNPAQSEGYVRIINLRHFQRLAALIDPEKVIYGGKMSEADLIIEPTIMHNVTFDDKVMEDEIFGPILPVITYTNLDEAIRQVKLRAKPLSCYIFTSNSKQRNKILSEVSFGGGAVNDTIMHLTNPSLPFGGVGCSGTGNYHGEAGFQAFSHYKSILQKSLIFEPPMKHLPYNETKFKLLKMFLE